MKNQRCAGCDEPEFMCECNKHHKNYKGAVVADVYHRGILIDGKELRRQAFTLRFLPTIVIGRFAFTMQCPDRHFGGTALAGRRNA